MTSFVYKSEIVLPSVRFHVFIDVLDEAGVVVAQVARERPLVEVWAQEVLNQIRTTSESFSALLANLKQNQDSFKVIFAPFLRATF